MSSTEVATHGGFEAGARLRAACSARGTEDSVDFGVIGDLFAVVDALHGF